MLTWTALTIWRPISGANVKSQPSKEDKNQNAGYNMLLLISIYNNS